MPTYYNYLGQPMPMSAAPLNTLYGSDAGGETLTAPTGASAVFASGPNDTVIGTNGDQTYYLLFRSDVLQVPSGLSGVKTAVVYSWYDLPPNVQNLYSSGVTNYAAGNALDNLIIVGNDGESLDGKGGNDVLVGGSGPSNAFIFTVGEGNDVIYNFKANDTVRILGGSFKKFQDVTAAMTQTGPDVVLHLDATHTLTFRSYTIAQFTASNFLMPLDRTLLGGLTYDDEFNGPQFYDFSNNTGLWRTDFGGPPNDVTNYTLPNNSELQVYVTPSFQGTGDHPLGLNPFSFNNGILTITAAQLTAAQSQASWGAQYYSGLLDTRGIFTQKYGYFEMRAAMPQSVGTWPAFWMIPDPQNGIEADISENLGVAYAYDYVRALSPEGLTAQFAYKPNPGPNVFHTYGMLWTATTTTFFLDDVEVMKIPTPASWTQPMYMLVNMAVGGWAGSPNPSQFPAKMQIDYIRAYALADGSTEVHHLTQAPPATITASGAPITIALQGNLADAKVLTNGNLALASNDYFNWGGHVAKATIVNSGSGATLVAPFQLYSYADVGDSTSPTITALDGGFSRFDFKGWEVHAPDGSSRFFQNDYTQGNPLFLPLVGGGEVITDPTWKDTFLFGDPQGQVTWVPKPMVNGKAATPNQDVALGGGGFAFSYAGSPQLDVYDSRGGHVITTQLGAPLAPYPVALEAIAGGGFAVAFLSPIGSGTDTNLMFQTFDATGHALTTAKAVALNRDPGHTVMTITPTSVAGQALLLWSEGGAVWGAFANGSSISAPQTLMVGDLANFTETPLTDGHILLTWMEPSAGRENMWAQVFDPQTFQWTRQQLGDGDGDLHIVALANGGFAASWRDGAIIEARAYDGHGHYGPQTTVSGPFLGLDAAGELVAVSADANGDALLQHYRVSDNFFG